MIGEFGTGRPARAGGRLRKRVGAFVAALIVFCAGLLAVAQPAHAETSCETVHLINVSSGLAVSAELNDVGIFKGELRARATTVGPWERFTMCIDDVNVFTLQSHGNGLYVSTEENYEPPYQYMLRARSSSVGSWEKFVLYNTGGDVQGFTGSPGYWVTADYNFAGGDHGLLLSNRKVLGSWEGWQIHLDG